jgi:A/G-specific adenine glycosylase
VSVPRRLSRAAADRRRDQAQLDAPTRAEKAKLTRLAKDLAKWWATSGRDYPWRADDAGTYERIVVEVLLQRTTAAAVSRFYPAFVGRFPGWQELADSRPDDLEEFLRPLGLWRRRAASLLGIAKYAAGSGGKFPSDPAEHAIIPAVGQYVSNAVLMFQHGKATPLLDVNMARVLERVVRPRRLADIRYDPWLQAAAKWFVRGSRPSETNWGVLDFAALVCKARRPLCETCPVNGYCTFFQGTRRKAGEPRSREAADR